MTLSFRTIVKILISVGCLALIPYFVPFQELLQQSRDIELSHMIVAFGLVAISTLLSSLRFHGMMKGFLISATLRSAHKINILSQLVGVFALQTVGQMVFRAAYGGQYVENPQRLALLTVVEKGIALATMSLIGLAGSFYITRHIEIGGGFLQVLVIASATILSGACSYLIALTQAQRRFSRRFWRWLIRSGFERATLLSFAMHGLMLLAYVVVASGLLDGASLTMTAALFSVVMLGAALPISFAGWGIRELSAGFVFSMLGYEPSVGIVVAATIGLVSLLALAAHALVVRFITRPLDYEESGEVAERNVENHFERMIALICGLGIAVLIGFQVRVPTNDGALTVNLADPIAFVAAISFLIIWYRDYLHQAAWRIRGLAPALCFLLALIVYGWLLGYWKNGFSYWATYNRELGYFVLLAYLFAGSMVAAFFGRGAVRWVVRAFLVTTACCLFLYVIMFGFLPAPTLWALNWDVRHFSGMFGNRNALAFAVLIALAVSLAVKSPIIGRWRPAAISLACFLVVISGSRTGMGVGALLIVVAAFNRRISAREIAQTAVSTALLVGALIAINNALPLIFRELGHVMSSDGLGTGWKSVATALQGFGRSYVAVESAAAKQLSDIQSERFEGYWVALDMWLSHPIFGAGMGAFLAHYLETTGVAFVIHNSGLWILAEMGLVGLVLFLPLPWAIIAHLLRSRGEKLEWDDCALLYCLIGVVVFSLAHDMLYQRILWFMLGLLAANKLLLKVTLTLRTRPALRAAQASFSSAQRTSSSRLPSQMK